MMYLNVDKLGDAVKEFGSLTVTYDVFKCYLLFAHLSANYCLTVTYDVFKYANVLWLILLALSLTVTYDVFKC